MAAPASGTFLMEPSWSAQRIADEARAFSQHLYRDHPDILEVQETFLNYSASQTALWPLLTPEERSSLDDFPIVVVPTGDFDVKMVSAPSGSGRFILFDYCILGELVDFFAAIPTQNYHVWAACVLRGATRKTFDLRFERASWVEAPMREIAELQNQGATLAPYSSSMLFGLRFCTDFLLGHEYAHHVLKHFRDEPEIDKPEAARITDHQLQANHDMEFAADAWSLNVISRLPVFELSTWLLTIEIMFWYLHLIELFDESCRTIEGATPGPADHPPFIARAERISRLGERIFEAQLDAAGNLPTPLYNNLHDRQQIWARVKKFGEYPHYLAECYYRDPEKTAAIHNAVRADKLGGDAYVKEMEAIMSNIGFIGRRIFRVTKEKLF